MGKPRDNASQLGYFGILATYISFFNIVIIGHIRDHFGKIFTPWNYSFYFEQNGVPALFSLFDSFFVRRLYKRISDCWNRPIRGVPGRRIQVMERLSDDYNTTFKFTGEVLDVLNTGSYNYLGFATSSGPIIDSVLRSVDMYPINYPYPAIDYLDAPVVRELEKELAGFLHQEDCLVFSMGYGTNSSGIPALMQDSLILSDELNHTSLVMGMKLCKSLVVVFVHNDMKDLESKLRFHITQGEPETHRPWKRIFVVVEGLYSMEGTVVNLKKLVDLKKIYKFYIYIDEAHSIGAMGETGRGICEHLGISHSDIDIHMGTFSKSFGGFGGYIAGKKEIVNYLRRHNDFVLYSEQMSCIVATQILESLRMIIKDDVRLKKLHENTRRIRKALEKRKFCLLGDDNSPVVPILIPSPGKIGDFSRLCLESGIAVAVVGYPATPLMLNRVRLCVSSSHTSEDIDRVVKVIDQIGSVVGMKK